MIALPIAAHDAEPVHALRIFTAPPEGHLLHIVGDDRLRPILRKGEIAVFDPEYYWPDDGSFFLKQGGCRTWTGGAIQHHWTIVETALSSKDRESWWTHPFYRSPQYKATIAAGIMPKRIGGFSDGPYISAVALADMLLGRLVGIYAPSGEVVL
jgi:hypothetical protein